MEALGRRGELRFEEECIRHGLVPMEPVGVKDYDVVVENNGDYFKVQVKSTQRKTKANRYEWNHLTGNADIFAFHILDTNDFYLIPRELIRGRKGFKINTNGKKYKMYLNNWAIFE
jgi:hypothetical protein